MIRHLLLAIFFAGAALGAELATAPDSLAKELEPLRPFIGKTWMGEFVGNTDKSKPPMKDISRWERTLNGAAIRIVHSVNDGIYVGETLILWSQENKRIETFYFTSTGDRSEGTMTVEKDGSFSTLETFLPETPSENPRNVTKARAVTKFLPNGRFHVKAEYLRKADWTPGHEIIYTESKDATVLFK